MLVVDAEDVQCTALRDTLQAAGLGHGLRTEGAELIVQVQTRRQWQF